MRLRLRVFFLAISRNVLIEMVELQRMHEDVTSWEHFIYIIETKENFRSQCVMIVWKKDYIEIRVKR